MQMIKFDLNDLVFFSGASLNATTPTGRTALHVASAQGQSKIVDVLLESGKCCFFQNIFLSFFHWIILEYIFLCDRLNDIFGS